MPNNARPASKTGAGCLILFALPFAAGGVGMGVWFVSTLLTCLSARHWVETPARIVRTDLKVHRGKSTTYEAIAEYTYDFGGRQYRGNRVSVSGGADNFGSFQQHAYQELTRYLRQGKPFRCYVNPARPDQALLYRDLRWETAAFQMIFVLVFGGIGFGLLAGGAAAYRQERTRAALASAHPDKPWMWKADWAAGQIVSSTKTAMVGSAIFALFWNLVSAAPLWIVLPGEIVRKGNHWALLGLVFPAIGLVLVAWALFCLIRWLKYGQSVFQMAAVPGQIGGQLAGVIRTSAKVRPEDGFHLALRCVRRLTTGSGKQRSTSEHVLWQDEQTVMHELLDDQTAVSAIPVVFQIPADCKPCDDADPNDQIVWRLTASAKVPGIDYSATFEAPVFKTGESAPPADATSEQ